MHMYVPQYAHWNALKRIIPYVKGTMHVGLYMNVSSPTNLVSYIDADWAGCLDTRRSTSGYCVYLGGNLIFWSSKRETTISRSNIEAEYREVANVVVEMCWIRNLLLELSLPPRHTSLVYCDNVSAIYLSQNPI